MPKIVVITPSELEFHAISRAVGDRHTVLCSGIGIINTMTTTIEAIERCRPELIIQVGIAGAIDRGVQIGEVVAVGEDRLVDLGAWRESEKRFERFENTTYYSTFVPLELRCVSAQTLNTACNPFVENVAQIETMEGAAFFAAAELKKTKCAQIRAVSNYTTQRREEWNIPLALQNLEDTLKTIF